MKGVIMAGGRGQRLYPLTRLTPKPLVPIMNRPVMEHCIDWMKAQGVREIAVTLHYLSQEIKSYFGDGKRFGVKLHYFEETEPLGTAGGVRGIESFLNETFIVVSGDILTDFHLGSALHFHRERQSSLTIVTTKVQNYKDYGVVMKDESGLIIEFNEKPSKQNITSSEVNTGIYIVEPSILTLVPKQLYFDFSHDFFPLLINKGEPLYGYELSGYWKDIGQFIQYWEAHEDYFRLELSEQEMSSHQIYIGPNCVIHPSVKLKGPVYIGEGCTIHKDAFIGPYTVIGNYTIIQSGVLIEKSVIWDFVQIGNNAVITKSVVATNSKVGSKVKLLENSIISKGSEIGNNSIISRNCKVGTARKVPDNSVIFNYVDKLESLGRDKLMGSTSIVICPNKGHSEILHFLIEEKTNINIDLSEGIKFIHNPCSWTEITVDNQKSCLIVHSKAEDQNKAKENTNHYVKKIIKFQKV